MRPLSDKRIRFLNLSENFITIDGVKIIAEFLKNNKTLQKLNLSRNAQTQFKSEGVKCILDSLLNNKNIEFIDFSFMNLTGCGESIGNFITKNKSIENIVLKNVLLNYNDFKNIFVPLKKSKTLKEIDVSMNDMGGDKSLQIIADAIKENTSLECLRIDQININNDNYNIIFEAIENNKTIQKYSINYNSDIKPKIVINFFMRQMQVKYLEYIPFDKENDNDKNKTLSLEERKMFEKLQADRPDLKLIYK
jgi:Ran GTPase-activating protein (RanGAP) involved in mRNA processing and transport